VTEPKKTRQEILAHFAAVADDIIANPEKYKKLTHEKARRECPWMTEEQLEASWQFVVQQFGL
jgi:hypothetical protein